MSSIPSKCRAAVIKKAGGPFEIVEVDVPKPEAGQILIKVCLKRQACNAEAPQASDSSITEGITSPVEGA